MLINKLNKAYPYRGRFSDSMKTFLFISGFIVVFVFIFRADSSFPDVSTGAKIFYSLLYGLSTFAGASLNTILCWLFISQKTENKWNVWMEVLLYLMHFFTISILLYILNGFIVEEYNRITVLAILGNFSKTFAVGIIPVTIHILLDQNKLYKQYYKQGQELESERKKREIVEQEDLISVGDNLIPVAEILYVESNKNYIHFYTSEVEPLIVRMTIKEFNDQLLNYPQFIRCHRAYIVNLDKVVKVDGNAQGLRLSIENSPFIVPVSRSYIPNVSDLLSLK